jgi:GDP-fucose protein O-fucosyltransferase
MILERINESSDATKVANQSINPGKPSSSSNLKKTTTSTAKSVTQITRKTTKDGRSIPILTLSDLNTSFENQIRQFPVARGVSGRPLAQTPALQNAQRAHIECDVPVDSLAYWNDPIGTRDMEQQSPFSVYSHSSNSKPPREMYISFAPDRGGWNNIRMSMEIIFVLAAATGRTLVLPPKEPLYLLHHDSTDRHRGFADFFPIHTAAFQKRVKVISFLEFLKKERNDPVLGLPVTINYNSILPSADHCDKRKNSANSCQPVLDYLQTVGYTPEISAAGSCIIFDEQMYENANATLAAAIQDYIHTVCGEKRQHVFFNHEQTIQHPLLHFKADQKEYRLLTHFYNMIHFTNPVYDHYYKRFVRDFLHYHDAIYCAAGKIVLALQWESALTRPPDHAPDPASGAGGFSALHVRRGDLQYKKVKLSAQEWYDNTKDIFKTNELLYVATDERDKNFFHDLAQHFELRFLDDYWDLAGLAQVDPNSMGMIDTIVASRGRVFVGTWFSTFSGYINRLRGYHGLSMQDSWYSFLPKKTAVHEWHIVDDFVYAYEYPDGWIGIDADVFPNRDRF